MSFIVRLIEQLIKEMRKMSAATDALTAAVSQNTVAVNNAVAALQNGGSNDALIQAAATQISTNNTALAAATPVVTPTA